MKLFVSGEKLIVSSDETTFYLAYHIKGYMQGNHY